jgi:hypothetical protein
MRFATSLLALGLAASSVSALQNIFVGTITTASGGLDNFVWFTDGPACTTGADLGPVSTSLCNDGSVTVLGHSGITFTGCAPASPYTGGAPSGVSDSGVPSLTCSTIGSFEVPCGGDIVVTGTQRCE